MVSGLHHRVHDVTNRSDTMTSPAPAPFTLARLARLARAGIAGAAATLIDVGVLTALVAGAHLDPRAASIPALVAGGIANFVGNRHFAFRAAGGNLARQAVLYTVVEAMALALNGILYDTVLRAWPVTAHAYWAVRLATSHAVFLLWSYPLWRRVFAVQSLNAGAPSSRA
jgi:putative flippase GtrA